ncbi:unnamed protein product [Musa hybrid cultivar]
MAQGTLAGIPHVLVLGFRRTLLDYIFILIWTPQLLTLTKHLPQLSTKDEVDACPICLEDKYYDAENPHVMTKCEHHFHCVAFLNGWRDETPVPSDCARKTNVARSNLMFWLRVSMSGSNSSEFLLWNSRKQKDVHHVGYHDQVYIDSTKSA